VTGGSIAGNVPADGAADGLFTSGLSGSELLLVREAGYDPVGLVMGSSVCEVALKGSDSVAQLTAPSYGTMYSRAPRDGGEITELTYAMTTARKAALKRLTDDARALGADGVIGITVETTWDSWHDGALEFMLTGTAIRARAAGGSTSGSAGGFAAVDRPADDSRAGPDGDPGRRVFTSCVCGQEFWALLRSGYRPVGFVMGYCPYAAEPEHSVTARELRGATRAIYEARELAVARMRSQAGHDFQARGIVGVRLDGLDGLSRLPQSRILEFRAIGTAIVPVDDAPGDVPRLPGLEPPVAVLPVGGQPGHRF
jgi:uncharacterized protein YbjQ (UPF0145 family)